MAIDEHVHLVLTLDTVGLTRPGFGTLMIVSHNAAWLERIRYYSSLVDVAVDFAVSSPEYRAARAVFSQTPKPPRIAIGRAGLAPTQAYSLNVRTVANSADYFLRVSGEGVTETTTDYASDSGATRAEIHAATIADLNAVVGRNYTAAAAALVFADAVFTADNTTDTLTSTAHGLLTGDGPFQVSNSGGGLPGGLVAVTNYWAIRTGADTFQLASSLDNALAGTAVALTTNGTGTQTISDTGSTASPAGSITVTASGPGAWFSIEALDASRWDVAQVHADPGVATDLAAIALENSDWYGLITLYNSDAYVKAASAWIEGDAQRLYFAAVSDSTAINVAADGTQGTLDDLHTLGYRRTAGFYHPAPDQFLDAVTMGRYFATDPGASVVAYKRLAGVTTTSLTGTHRVNLNARKANYYKREAGIGITWKGHTVSGEWVDVTRDLDWVFSDMQLGIFGALAAQEKIPYTDAGVTLIKNYVRATLARAVARGIFAADPQPQVTAPRVADVSPADKAARHLPDVKWSATLAGAILTVDVTGVVSQ